MTVDPVQLEIFKSLFHSIAEEMGATLKRTAFSPNIKERRDYSCAVFDRDGNMVSQGDHMPVHLGSMPLSVKAAIGSRKIGPGDMVILNDPYAGGTHLPDITLVSGVFDGKVLRFYVASRAHHSDVGGMSPGSMPVAEEIYQEGLRIPPVHLMLSGVMCKDVLELILLNVRTPKEREGDLSAMIAANRTGELRLIESIRRYGWSQVQRYVQEILNYSERMTRTAIRSIPDGTYTAEDFLDDDGIGNTPIRIAVKIRIRGDKASVDFTSSDLQAAGSINAVYAITASAVFYVFRTLVGCADSFECRRNASARDHRSARHSRECASACSRVRRQCGNVPKNSGCSLQVSGTGVAESNSICQPGHNEQRDIWRNGPAYARAIRILRNGVWRHGRPAGHEWNLRSSHPHDELHEHAGGSIRT